jgi:hypothetical protein
MTLPGGTDPAEALRGLGLLTLALVIGVRFVPALRTRKRLVGYISLALYFGGGALILALGYLL